MQKDRSVPVGTIESLGVWSRMPLSDCLHRSIVPFLLRPAVASLWRGLLFAGAPQLEERRRHPDYGGQAGTDSSLITLTQHFVLGFREVPAGPIFSNRQQRS
jgi:hypothetical protein